MNFSKKNHENQNNSKMNVSRTLRILTMCLITTMSFAQKKETKASQNIKVNKDVVVDLNTNYVEIEVDTWSKDVVEIEAYLESSKLSEEELKKAVKAWNLNIDASADKVYISSDGGRNFAFFSEESYDDILKELEFSLADLPEVPEISGLSNLPTIISLKDLPELPELPEMPEFPELPELPEGIKSISFDYDRYQKEGESYLSEWSKKYEKKGGKELQKRMEEWAKKFSESGYQEKMEKWGKEYGKRFEGKWAKDMEKWGEEFGEKFGKDMEKWGEEFGKSFGKDWEKKMQAWGERFGKQMEKQGKAIEKRAKAMEERTRAMEERAEAMKERKEAIKEERLARAEELAARKEAMENRKASFYTNSYGSGSNSKVKRVIKIKMPKKAKLKLNVRHGELKIASLLNNIEGDISHTFLVAEHIDGSNTSINVSYSPMVINNWNLGTLNLNFVEKAQIKNATNLVLNSKSSNIAIDNLTDTGIIDGSFGDLTISNLADSFKNLNLILENSDALISLPKSVDYNLYFKGNRSKYNNAPTTQKTVRKDDNGQSSNKNIIVNAKYSSVIMN